MCIRDRFLIILALLLTLQVVSVQIVPGFGWYLFCGFCLALSVIVPGMSFSTLLMPLGLYTPFIDGIGRFDFGVLIPGGIGALLTILLLARAVTHLMDCLLYTSGGRAKRPAGCG